MVWVTLISQSMVNIAKSGTNLGMEENFGTQETFVANVYCNGWVFRVLCDVFDRQPLFGFTVVFLELLRQVTADVRVATQNGNRHTKIKLSAN